MSTPVIVCRLVASLLALGMSAAHAMTFVEPSDDGLFEAADAIVLGRIAGAAPDAGEPLDASRYELQVEEVLKGAIYDSALQLRVPGAHDPAREGALIVPGAPRFATSERVLAFLERRSDGSFAVSQLALGAFHVREAADGEQVLVRDLDGAHALHLKSSSDAHSEEPQGLRSLAPFREWLRARSRGLSASSAYWSTHAEADLPQAKFALMGTPPVRWFAFDEGRSVPLHAGETGQLGIAGGGYAQFQAAIRAWNDDAGSNIRYAYAGLSAASGGLDRLDGVNLIRFNDPDGAIAGAFDCRNGGVVALAGYRSSGALRSFNGVQYHPIQEVDIAVQDGAGCMLADLLGSNATEIFAHELGHTLGLGHACGDAGQAACVAGSRADQSLMRPVIHADGRGATLGADDRAAVGYLYPASGAPASQAPTPPATPAPAPTGESAGSGGGGSFGALALALLGLAIGRRLTPAARQARRPPARVCGRAR